MTKCPICKATNLSTDSMGETMVFEEDIDRELSFALGESFGRDDITHVFVHLKRFKKKDLDAMTPADFNNLFIEEWRRLGKFDENGYDYHIDAVDLLKKKKLD